LPTLNLEIQELADFLSGYSSVNAGAFNLGCRLLGEGTGGLALPEAVLNE
jgi:hypothetical protein